MENVKKKDNVFSLLHFAYFELVYTKECTLYSAITSIQRIMKWRVINAGFYRLFHTAWTMHSLLRSIAVSAQHSPCLSLAEDHQHAVSGATKLTTCLVSSRTDHTLCMIVPSQTGAERPTFFCFRFFLIIYITWMIKQPWIALWIISNVAEFRTIVWCNYRHCEKPVLMTWYSLTW
jgi:hypothetical protein